MCDVEKGLTAIKLTNGKTKYFCYSHNIFRSTKKDIRRK